jgi:putative MATE family efflux protein
MSTARTRDLTTGSIPQHLFNLSLPMVWGILAIVSMQLADVYFIAGLGRVPLEAISFTFPVSMAVFSLVMGMSIATASVCARLIGARDTDGMKHFLGHALFIAFITGILLAILGEIIIRPLFVAMGAGPEHINDIMDFMRISLWGYVFITIPLVGNAALRAAGDSFVPSLIMIGVAIFNIPLSYALVHGDWGFPDMGVSGAATANVIANFLAACGGLIVLLKRGLIDKSCLTFNNFSNSAKRLLTIAIPVGLANLIGPIVAGIITSMLATSGTAAVAAFGIVTRIEAVAAVILMALSIGLGPIIGQNFGAKKYDRIEATITLALRFSVYWSFAVGISMMLAGSMIARQFTVEPDIIHIVATYFILTGVTGAIANLAVGWGSVWNALGKPQFSVGIQVVQSLIGTVLFAWVGHLLGGWFGLFTALAIRNLVFGIAIHRFSLARYRVIAAATSAS